MKKYITSLTALSFSALCLAGASNAFADCDLMNSPEWDELSSQMATAYDIGNYESALGYGKRLTLICNRSPIVNFTMSEIYRKMNNENESYNYVKRATEYLLDYPVPQALTERIWMRRAELELPYKKQLEDLQNQLATGTGEIGSKQQQLQNNLYTTEMKLERAKQRRLEMLNSQLKLLNTTKWIGAGTAIGGLVIAGAGAGLIGANYGDARDAYNDVKNSAKKIKPFDKKDKMVHAGLILLAGGVGMGIAGTAVALYSFVKENHIRDTNKDVFEDTAEEVIAPPTASVEFNFDVSPNSVAFGMTF
ncbi:MAG: hypothetical protein J6A01_02625 [Proteobacteria bacterium]|nr:hypothetical protein [Pseudomonadota bacterium]